MDSRVKSLKTFNSSRPSTIMVFALRHQPFKTLYVAVELVATLFVRLPYWCIVYIPRSLRPRPSWSWSQSVLLSFLRLASAYGPLSARVEPLLPLPNHLAVPHDRSGKLKYAWVDPTPELIVGQVKKWADIAGVEAMRIPGYWHDRKGFNTPVGQAPSSGEKVLYYLHGGAYFAQTAHPSDFFTYLIRKFLQSHSSLKRGFALEYRLSRGPPHKLENPFPAALIDALAGYVYLINIGFSPADIILGGDSAGANLALALTRYLIENKDGSLPPPPGLLFLSSPWTDLGTSHDGPTSSLRMNEVSDFLVNMDGGAMLYARSSFCGVLGFPSAANSNPYISPGSVHPDMDPVSFAGFPKTFIFGSTGETLFDQIRTLRAKMAKELGEDWVTYYEMEDAPHDAIVLFIWDKQNKAAYKAIEKWLDTVL